MSAAAFFRTAAAPAQAEPFRKVKAVHVLTSSASNEAYTPPDILAAARASLRGTIDLDPASCAVANEEVRATRYFDAAEMTVPWVDDVCLIEPQQGGLFLPWGTPKKPSRVWLNPPGGFVNRKTMLPSTRGMSSACAWWYQLLDEYRAGRVKAACFYTFRLDVLQNIQARVDCEPPQAFPFVILKARPRHWSTGTPREHRGKKGQPTHACAVFFLPERGAGYVTSKYPTAPGWARSESIELFRDSFAPLGYVRE